MIFRTEVLPSALGEDKWRHLCFARTTSSNDYFVFVNGRLDVRGGPLNTDAKIGGIGRKFVLGQAWDKASRSFLQAHSYAGYMNDVNMWNEVFTLVRVRQLYLTRGFVDGNAVPWSQLKSATPPSLVSASASKCPAKRGTSHIFI